VSFSGLTFLVGFCPYSGMHHGIRRKEHGGLVCLPVSLVGWQVL